MTRTPEALFATLAAETYDLSQETMDEATARRDELIPLLLEELEMAVEEDYPKRAGGEWMRLPLAFLLLAQFREKRAFRPLIRLLNLSAARVETLFGEYLAGCMGRVLASVCDGDETALRDLIENRDADELVRSACVDCYLAIMMLGIVERDRVETYFGELLDSRLEREPNYIWDSVSASCGDMCFAKLLPSIRRAFDEGLCDPAFNLLEDVEAGALSGAIAVTPHDRFTMIEDGIDEALYWAGAGHLRMHNFGLIPDPPDMKVGRNEPCPCGSGKKYKKCCGKPG